MPELSSFYGIVIRMYYEDHNPPHLPAIYGEHEAVYRLDSLSVLRGQLPDRAHSLVLEWADDNRVAIESAWRSVQANDPPEAVPPLN